MRIRDGFTQRRVSHAAARAWLTAGLVVLAGWQACAQAAPTITAFQSPSGNVHCMIDTGAEPAAIASCELRTYTGEAPAKPADCELDWVPGASLDTRGRVGVFACQGDTLQSPDSEKLAYGSSITRGAITCRSATTGITCTLGSGRGFQVSRAAIRKL